MTYSRCQLKNITQFMDNQEGHSILPGYKHKFNGRYIEGTPFDSLHWSLKVEFINAYLEDMGADEEICERLEDRRLYHAFLKYPCETTQKALFKVYLDVNKSNIMEAYQEAMERLETGYKVQESPENNKNFPHKYQQFKWTAP